MANTPTKRSVATVKPRDKAPITVPLSYGPTPTPAQAGQMLTSALATYDFEYWMRMWPDPDLLIQNSIITRPSLRKLMADDEIYQVVDTRRSALEATPWRLETPDGKSDTPQLDFIREQMEHHQEHLIGAAFNSVLYGYAVNELVWGREGSRNVVLESMEKPFEWFAPRPDGTLLFLERGAGQEWPPAKYILSRNHATYRNPYGEALLLRCYWPWFFRCQGWSFWLQCLERYGMPFLVAQLENPNLEVEGTGGKTMLQYVTEMLDRARRGSALAVDSSTKIDNIESTGKGEHFAIFEERIVARIAKTVLGQTLTSNVSTAGGSRALGEVHDKVREDKRRSDIKIATRSLQSFVTYLWLFNGFSGLPPKVLLQDDVGLESERATRDSTLQPVLEKSGLRFKKDYFIERYDINEDDLEEIDDEEVSSGEQKVPKQAGQAEPETEDEVADLRALVFGASGEEDLKARCALRFGEGTPDYDKFLGWGLRLAKVIGYLGDEQ